MATKKKVELKAFDVAEHLRTPEEMAAYLDACIDESDGDSAFIELLEDYPQQSSPTQLHKYNKAQIIHIT